MRTVEKRWPRQWSNRVKPRYKPLLAIQKDEKVALNPRKSPFGVTSSYNYWIDLYNIVKLISKVDTNHNIPQWIFLSSP
jgi:hypothetical protein